MKSHGIWNLFVATVLVALPATGFGGEAHRMFRIGVLATDARYCGYPELREGLRALGYVEGRNISFDCRHANGRYQDLPAVARELLRLKPDVIVPRTHPVAEVALRETRDIPVVTVASGDPVSAGWAASLARPGGNFTGLTYFAWELYAKRLELLKVMLPDLRRVGVLVQTNESKTLTEIYLRVSRASAKALGLELVVFEANDHAGLEQAFGAIAKANIRAVHVPGYLIYGEEAQKIADLARFHGIATMHFLHNFPSSGGLLGYGPDYPEMRLRMAPYIDKILKGAKPAELPIEQPSRLMLSINLATAHELGLKVPESLLLRADNVIE
jgi:putative ABC transport system substrate-binding protein